MPDEAKRDAVEYRFDLIPPEAHRAVALMFGVGAAKYGDDNWKAGYSGHKGPLNHAEEHLCTYKEYLTFVRRDSDVSDGTRLILKGELAAIITNLYIEYYFRAHPETYDLDNRRKD